MKTFNVGETVAVRPTGDPEIDQFFGEVMTIVEIEHVNDCGYRYISYHVRAQNGSETTVLEKEISHVIQETS